ncbi:hypothetical protein [Thermoflavimicrobium dichotomicum]|uniref:hypothetical protein n=1 Tax=Thermoflavimicrobium dichotomicum TaxID=46223 RepID=UPI001FE11E7D|nr:hypothetical protein [Thermoflavimicrobium dichotomicum]
MNSLLEGFENKIPPSERWHTMAIKKCTELKKKKKQIDMMIKILEEGLSVSVLLGLIVF